MHIHYRPYLRKKFSHSSTGTIYIRIVCESKYIYHNTQIELPVKNWDAKKRRVRKNHPNAVQLNDLIAQEQYQCQRAVIDFRLKGNDVTFDSIKQLFTITLNCTTIKQLFDRYVEANAVSGNRKYQMASAAKICIENGLPDSVEKVRESHLMKLKSVLGKKYKKNTTIGIFTRLFAALNWAVKMQIINVHPGKNVKLGSYEAKPAFLSETELLAIHAAAGRLKTHLQPICHMFLFACYTGLRFSDLTALRASQLVETANGPAIHLIAKKTGKQQVIPLLSQAAELWPAVVGKKYTNEYYNRSLKEIGKAAGIAQPLTSHLARHTFATIGLSKGIRIEYMQSFLGHSNIKTTQGYAKLMDKNKFEELAKMENKAVPAGFIHEPKPAGQFGVTGMA